MSEDGKLICYDWREIEDDSYECICPNCMCVIIVVGNEPFLCDGCDAEFTLGDREQIRVRICENCIHCTYIGQSKLPEVCLKCVKQDHFKPREGINDAENR